VADKTSGGDNNVMDFVTLSEGPSGRPAGTKQQNDKGVPLAAGIKRYGITGLQALMVGMGQPAYRADQLIEWLYGRAVASYDEMTNIPASLRDSLKESQPLDKPEVISKSVSADGTRKYLLKLADGAKIETVAIPDRSRLTVCFSTQVGCGMACTFCATGRLGLIRQLGPGEIVDQLAIASEDFGQRVTNAVAMGEGEPFANYSATLDALRLMNHPKGLNIGARHITVSTAGVIPGIMAFAAEPEQFRLAVSLHSANQAMRDTLMPGLTAYSLTALQHTLISYGQAVGRRVSLEYVLIDGVNDTEEAVFELITFCSELNCHVNLINLNVIGADPDYFIPTAPAKAREIRSQLRAAGIETSLRRSRGVDIAGACGQLAGEQ